MNATMKTADLNHTMFYTKLADLWTPDESNEKVVNRMDCRKYDGTTNHTTTDRQKVHPKAGKPVLHKQKWNKGKQTEDFLIIWERRQMRRRRSSMVQLD